MQPIEILESIRQNIRKVIVGRTDTIDLLLTSLVAGGHVLLEDVPGTGKTLLAKSLAKSMSLVFSRIQFTPDLLPSDVTGLNYFDQKESAFVLQKGPELLTFYLQMRSTALLLAPSPAFWNPWRSIR